MSVLTEVQRRRRARPWKKRLLVGLFLLASIGVGAGAAASYLYDRSQQDRIARGVSVQGIDIGGLSVTEARAILRRRLLPPVERKLILRHGHRRFRLTPAAIGFRLDIRGAVETALEASRRGGFLHRVYRELRGRSLNLSIEPGVRYSPRLLAAFVRRVGRALATPPVAARFVPSLLRPRIVAARNGTAVRRSALAQEIAARLRDPDLPRSVAVPTHAIAAKPTTRALARKYDSYISVSRGERRLRLFKRLRLVKTYVIAVGRIGLETPAGMYRVEDKQINPSWHVPKSPWAGSLAGEVIPPGPDDPLKARWLGFYDGAGIHGTDNLSSLGSAASHGCIRMAIPDVVQLYDAVPLHTPIYVR